ncbi:MAG: BtpA/SgcQ family protein [Acidimicrobiia bacterium]
MVHLLPLPGSPRFGGSIDEVVEVARADAETLIAAGFPALIVENFGDTPFYTDQVPPETVAAMTVAVAAVATSGVPVGVNVLRNDGLAALGIAAATGARFIRVNVLTGMMYTDQGPIVGRAADIQRRRAVIAPDVEVWADVMVKHATPPPGMDLGQAARDAVERGLADAVILSGSGTGEEPSRQDGEMIKRALPPGTRIVVGSGAGLHNLRPLLDVADTVIVGTSIKVDGETANRPDPVRARALVEKAAERGLI